MKVIHIIASPRGKDSNTLKITQEFLNSLIASQDDLTVETVDLYREDLPAVAGSNIESRYQLIVGQPIDPEHEESWKNIEALIDHFLQADVVLISTPMWNFSIPYALKYYIDCLVQPGYTFGFNSEGAYGMIKDTQMVVITSRGNNYSSNSPMRPYDHQEPYLRTVFEFIGFRDIEFINAEPMDIAPHLRDVSLEKAKKKAREVASKITVTSTTAIV